MSSHRGLFASLGGRFGKGVSLAVAGLIVMSGQNLAYAGTDTSTSPTDATSTAPAPRSEYIVRFAAGTADAQRQDALAAADAVSLSSVPALRGTAPLPLVVNCVEPYGCVKVYVEFGQSPPVTATRMRPKTICSPSTGAPFVNEPSSAVRTNALPGEDPLQPGVVTLSDVATW